MDGSEGVQGLTILEQFAAMAMQGILANGSQMQSIAQLSGKNGIPTSVIVADVAFDYATDLIARLRKATK